MANIQKFMIVLFLTSKPCKIVDKPVLPNQKDRFCLDQAQHMFLPVVHSG